MDIWRMKTYFVSNMNRVRHEGLERKAQELSLSEDELATAVANNRLNHSVYNRWYVRFAIALVGLYLVLVHKVDPPSILVPFVTNLTKFGVYYVALVATICTLFAFARVNIADSDLVIKKIIGSDELRDFKITLLHCNSFGFLDWNFDQLRGHQEHTLLSFLIFPAFYLLSMLPILAMFLALELYIPVQLLLYQWRSLDFSSTFEVVLFVLPLLGFFVFWLIRGALHIPTIFAYHKELREMLDATDDEKDDKSKVLAKVYQLPWYKRLRFGSPD